MSVTIATASWGNDLLLKLQPLWKEAILCDTTIECSQKSIIQAHSILLAAASPKLSSYFRVAEQGIYTIVTPDVPVYVWRNILSYIYEGRLELRESSELVPTYNFACKIEIHSLTKKLGDELKRCKLTLEDQEAYLRACAVPQRPVMSPRDHVTSPSSPVGVHNVVIAPQTVVTSPHTFPTSPRVVISPMSVAPGQLPRLETTADVPMVTQPEQSSSRQSTHSIPSQSQQARQIPANTQDNIITTERHECPGCLQNFNRKSALQKHVSECAKLTAKSPVVSYKNFYTRIVDGEKGKEHTSKFKCDLCSKEYAAYQGLYMHLKSKHGNQVQAVAATNNHFRPGQLVNKRSKSQLLNKSAVCSICGKQFLTYSAMLSHKSMHSTATTRRSSSSTVRDESSTEGSDAAGDFWCHLCDHRPFKQKMHLGSHLRSHERNT